MKEPIIAREGLRIIVPSLVLSAVLLLGKFFFLTALVFCFALFCLYFFRNPRRRPADAGAGVLISPADGTVIDVSDMAEEEFLGGDVTRIAIFMSPTDVHVNRAPCAGRVVSMKHVAGRFAMAFGKDIELKNERNFILFENDGDRILIVQIAGFLARRIISYVKPDQRVTQGQAVGMIAFGSRVDIYFCKGYEPVVDLHAKVKAGSTVLARKKGVQ